MKQDFSKPWYQSRTIWGAVVSIGASVAALADVTVPDTTQAILADSLFQLTAVGGGIFSILGRLRAEQPVR
ncbi:hypothetical protein [Coralliovum pocilloporae]|uniref:hypothetical protein n=1 Tax=Coralliovum pocilloporae TaxID=3066369 RepID=UPI0033072770